MIGGEPGSLTDFYRQSDGWLWDCFLMARGLGALAVVASSDPPPDEPCLPADFRRDIY